MKVLSVGDKIKLQRAQAITRAALSRLDQEGIAHHEATAGHHTVAEAYSFWPPTGFWRSHDGKAQGYGIGQLIFAAKATA